MPPPGGRGHGRGGGSAPPPGGRGRRLGGASATFQGPIFRRHLQAVQFKGYNSRRGRGRARNSRSGRSGLGPSKGRLQSPPCEDHVAEQTPVSSSSKLLGSLKESSDAATSSSTLEAHFPDSTEISESLPTILLHYRPDWYFKFYIRRDLSQSFHTYPDVGGPFKSLQEAKNAIDCHLDSLQHETMRKESLDKLSPMDSLIQQSLYWPDGSRRKCSKAVAIKNARRESGHLLEALVAKYNEDHKLFGDVAYELKDALNYQSMREEHICYSHLNFTAKKKGSGGIDLFFSEVLEGLEITVSCLCTINTDANGCCHGCTDHGNVGMKHPNKANTYKAGHPSRYFLSEHTGEWDVSDDDEAVKAEEDRLRVCLFGLLLLKSSCSWWTVRKQLWEAAAGS